MKAGDWRLCASTGALRIRHSDGVCKPAKGALFKRQGTERLEKRWRRRRHQVSGKKLSESKPSMICRKENLLAKLLDLCTDRKTVTDT
jgi:hypothetical protein